MLFLLSACLPSKDDPDDTPGGNEESAGESAGDTSSDTAGETGEDSGDTDTTEESGESGGETGEDNGGSGGETGVRDTVSGVVTWNVDFSADAEAQGAIDCSYARTYTGSEDRSAPWQCPTCELVFQVEVDLDRGDGDCYGQVSSTEPFTTEWLGYGGGVWYRGAGSALTERGPSTFDGTTWTVEQDAESESESGLALTFHIEGTLTVGEEAGDPLHGWGAPDTYACGWPKADPPPYEGDYVLALGETVPDALLRDVCEEPVRLHDLAGRYLLVDISAMDCGPCQSAADDETAWEADMAELGIDVMMVTMLAPSLSNTSGTPTTDELTAWIDAFGLHSPILADRSWGLAVAYPFHGDDFGYPTFILVDPDLKVLATGVGYGGFDEWTDAITADWEARGN